MAQPKFPFNDQVPQASQKIASTQKPILSNFQAINELITQNHIGFTDVVNYGKHTVTTFPVQSVAPVTGAAQMSLYAATTTTPNGIELFYQYPAAGSTVQLTGNQNSTGTGSGLPNAQGWAVLAGSLILKWGSVTISSATQVITYPVAGSIPVFSTAVYSVQVSMQIRQSNFYTSNLTTTTFTMNTVQGVGSVIYWYAIGS